MNQRPPVKRGTTLALLLAVAVAPSLGSLASLWIWPGGVGATVYAVCKTVLYGVPAAVGWLCLARADVIAAVRRGWAAAWLGIVSGLLVGGAIVVLWFGGLADHTDTTKLIEVVADNRLDDPLTFWVFAAWLCIGNSLLEEFVFRWFIDSRLRALGVRPALVLLLSAAIFTAHHVIVLAAFFEVDLVVLGSAGVFTGGFIWSWSLRRWGSILPGWIMHSLIDVAVMVIGASILGIGI